MEEFVRKALEISKFKELNPVQREALERGLLKGKNLVVFAPTSSGKTLIAEIAALKTILKEKRKVVYLVPLVALANEKYETFKKKYEKIGIKVAISVGDFDSSDPFLANYDWIIVTNEKLESLIRHKAEWIKDIGLVIVDEVHLLNDPSRGPTLEVLITLLRKILPKSQFILLSATINNFYEIAAWMNAEIVYSEWRPVKLYKGIAYDFKIKFFDWNEIKLNELEEIEKAIVDYVLKNRKQILIFVSTRRKAESLAEKLSKFVKNFLGRSEKEILNKISLEIENVLEVPTKQCKREAKVIRNGVAFHHAGLLGKQKRIIEENFRKGLIKIIVATPTMAMGVNLPSWFVVVRDVKRYYPGFGSVYLPVLEVEQMLGRAGRIDYDKEGFGVLVARNEDEARILEDRYIFGEPERIRSKLASEPALRMHTLGLISTNICNSLESLMNFFEKTFFAYQFGNLFLIEEKIEEIIEDLKDWDFVKERKGILIATRLGKRISELYLDPLSAHRFVDGLKNWNKRKITEFSFLQLASYSREMIPFLSLRSGEFFEYSEELEKRKEEILVDIPEEWEDEYEEFLSAFKLAKMFEDWINEKTEDEILDKYKVTPGELWNRLQIMDWLLYSLEEIALILKIKEVLKVIRKTRVRVEYGVKEELLPLVKIKGIGRIRARKLFNSKIKSISDLRKVPLESLAKIVGPKIAKKIKDQVEGRKEVKEKQLVLG
ncbi:MAG: hypothetical protein B6U78_02250 [Candidatus Aenigmarchaeota archaeon ex4484_224]|nr:MAG: hypothetical protein B6U78_02250 [Candidatus Aenigmarchaeota archaeon ex4484_224]